MVSQTAEGITVRAPDPAKDGYETIIKLDLDRSAGDIPILNVGESGNNSPGKN